MADNTLEGTLAVRDAMTLSNTESDLTGPAWPFFLSNNM